MTLRGKSPLLSKFHVIWSLNSHFSMRLMTIQIWLIMDLWCRKRIMLSLTLKYYLCLLQPLILACRTMSSQSLARCLHCILDRCSVHYEDEWERRRGFLTLKVTLSWIVFVVCSMDYVHRYGLRMALSHELIRFLQSKCWWINKNFKLLDRMSIMRWYPRIKICL